MSSSSMPKLVIVTGANGFIASSLTKMLLEQGYKVRGTVRDPSDESKTAALKAMTNASTHLEIVPLELTAPDDAFRAALKDVEWVIHIASPVHLGKVQDEQELIRPAVEGTLSMLRAAQASSTVRKFVLTSSVAAIAPGHDDKKNFTEDDWANLDSPYVDAYDKSKTLAERAAWQFMEDNTTNFTLSVINPTIVLGPVTSKDVRSSIEILSRILGAQDPFCINMFCPLVDVRDVARAHIQAAKIPEAAGKRFILNQSDGGELFMPQIAAVLKSQFGPMGYTIRTFVLPKFLVWLLSWFDANVASFYHMIDVRVHFDNSLSRDVLQLEYIAAAQTILDGGHSLIEHGIPAKTWLQTATEGLDA